MPELMANIYKSFALIPEGTTSLSNKTPYIESFATKTPIEK